MTDTPVVDGVLTERVHVDDLRVGVHHDPRQHIDAVHGVTLELHRDILHLAIHQQTQGQGAPCPVVVTNAALGARDLIVAHGLTEPGGLVDPHGAGVEIDHGVGPVLMHDLRVGPVAPRGADHLTRFALGKQT